MRMTKIDRLAISVGAVVLLGSVTLGLTQLDDFLALDPSARAAWVQAIGSVAAITAGFVLYLLEARRAHRQNDLRQAALLSSAWHAGRFVLSVILGLLEQSRLDDYDPVRSTVETKGAFEVAAVELRAVPKSELEDADAIHAVYMLTALLQSSREFAELDFETSAKEKVRPVFSDLVSVVEEIEKQTSRLSNLRDKRLGR